MDVKTRLAAGIADGSTLLAEDWFVDTMTGWRPSRAWRLFYQLFVRGGFDHPGRLSSAFVDP